MDIDKEKVQDWIKTHWTASRKCIVCQHEDWLLLERVWELKEFQGGTPVLPVVALMCNVCGQTIFFNAIAVKAVERDALQEELNGWR